MKKFSNLTEKIPEIFLFTLSGAWFLGGIYAIAYVLITNPNQETQVRYFHTVQECLDAQINSLRCQKAYNLARNEHWENYWVFGDKETCEEKAPTISSECEAVLSMGKKTAYKPIVSHPPN